MRQNLRVLAIAILLAAGMSLGWWNFPSAVSSAQIGGGTLILTKNPMIDGLYIGFPMTRKAELLSRGFSPKGEGTTTVWTNPRSSVKISSSKMTDQIDSIDGGTNVVIEGRTFSVNVVPRELHKFVASYSTEHTIVKDATVACRLQAPSAFIMLVAELKPEARAFHLVRDNKNDKFQFADLELKSGP